MDAVAAAAGAGKAGLPTEVTDSVFVYRISSGGYKKVKPSYITKETCLANFVKALTEFFFAKGPSHQWHLRLICDNCTPQLLQAARAIVAKLQDKVSVVTTSHGNGAASFRDGMKFVLEDCPLHDECKVYFVEDDYLHTEGAIEAIFEGLNFADFSTGYDHPDKYGHRVEPSGNVARLPAVPFVEKGAEKGTAVYLGRCGHFRRTNSTTMTFAAKVSTLRRCERTIRRWTSGTHPHDFHMFLDLSQEDSAAVVCTIPARSTHGETAYLASHPAGGKTWETIAAESRQKKKR